MKKRLLPSTFANHPRPVALVTGAASRLGGAISWKLARMGMRVALHYGKSLDATKRLQKNLTEAGFEAFRVGGDLRQTERLDAIPREVIARWGRLDLLVNNASVFKPTPLQSRRWSDWNLFFTVNAIAPCALALAARPWLGRSRGSIVNIADIYADMPILKDYPAYCASKAGLIALTRYLAVELAPLIRVNAVSPGVITFPETYARARRRKLVQKSLLKRQGHPIDIAEAVYFLAVSPFVTGQVLKVDGGRFTS